MDSFEQKVERTIAQLQHEGVQSIAAGITRNRMAWLDRTLPGKPGYAGYTPREVYELLFFENMGLERSELPVVSESPDRIVWLSTNRCPLLEACVRLGLDTRRVCRPANEKATQAFVSRINPQLRFHRSYEEIRPHTAYCREWIARVDFAACMRVAIGEARCSRVAGYAAHGAVVVLDNRIIGRAHDTSAVERDPSRHAAAQAIDQAAQVTGDADLCGAILFSTAEPCPLCASRAARANLTTIVYGVAAEELAGLGRAPTAISAGEIIARSGCAIEVIGGVLHDECRALS